MTEKRMRYFNGQFLQEEDFQAEQSYHVDRQRRHNRTLHTPGIAEGLAVTADVGATTVEVAGGTAIDSSGQMIVLEDSRTVDILAEHQGQTVLLVISYREEPSDPATVGSNGATRTHERPNVELFVEAAAPPVDTHIRLARLLVTAGGTVSAHQPDVRANAGVRLSGELEIRRLRLSRAGVDPSQWPALSSGAPRRADVDGNLQVSGNITATGTVAGTLANNIVGATALADSTVSLRKLNTQLVVNATLSIPAGASVPVVIATAPIAQGPALSLLLVRAFSRTANARFSWNQGSITSADGQQTQQVIFFRSEGVAIQVEYEVFEVLAG